LRGSDQLSEAIKSFQRAYDLHPDSEVFRKDFVETCFDAAQPQTAIAAVRRRLGANTVSYKDHYFLACLLRYTGDYSGYREACRTMFDEFSKADDLASRHGLLSAWLFFPEAEFPEAEEVTSELLQVAKTNAERGGPIHKRHLGMAYYRLGDDERALSILEEAADARLAPNSKITSLLCLALAQLRVGDLDAARESINRARTLHENSSEMDVSLDRQLWGVIPSLWREVQAAMKDKIEEPIPELPTTLSAEAAATRDVSAISVPPPA
jgi:tetratricopeptide (TPR) repeat protein